MGKKKFAIIVMCCAFALAMGLVGCGGSSSGSAAASGSASGASASGSASAGAGDAKAGYTADGYLDEFGIVTAKALVELDGAELTKVVESAKYEWDEKRAEWTKVGSEAAPSKGLSAEDFEAALSDTDSTAMFHFTPEEFAGLAAGGKGTPLKWLVTSKAKIDNVEQVLANQQVTVVEQCEVEHRNYGKQIWAIVQNSAGDKFLLCASHYSGTSSIDLFNADYLAYNSRGVASSFNSGDYLLEDAHTIEAAFEVIKSGQVS